MNWHEVTKIIPIAGAGVCAALAILMRKHGDKRVARYALMATIFVAALSIALYWTGYNEAAKPGFLARLGLWSLKIKAAIAGVGLAMLSRVHIQALLPIFYSLLGIAIAAGSMMTVALLD